MCLSRSVACLTQPRPLFTTRFHRERRERISQGQRRNLTASTSIYHVHGIYAIDVPTARLHLTFHVEQPARLLKWEKPRNEAKYAR